jgi:hypothetical protein
MKHKGNNKYLQLVAILTQHFSQPWRMSVSRKEPQVPLTSHHLTPQHSCQRQRISTQNGGNQNALVQNTNEVTFTR